MTTNQHTIFVAGATGILGRRAVPLLVAAGHRVTGIGRTPEKAAQLEAAGASSVNVDLFDAAAIKEAVDGHDVVANLATHIPSVTKMRLRSAWKENDRIRAEGSRNLVDAALATGAGRYIQEQICFLYADGGDAWLDEDSPMDAPDYVTSGLQAEQQAQRVTDAGGAGVVLRFGMFHAADSDQTKMTVRAARRRVMTMFGEKTGYLPTITVDDCATAVVAALHAPAGVYNIVDDEPLTRAEYAAALAAAVGVKSLRHPPKLATKAAGEQGAMLARSQRISNRRFKDATGWAPQYPSMRTGWPAIVRSMQDDGDA
jgi:nucleoside-diphosphate-sugar epimerase